MDISSLQAQAHDLAKRKGFWDGDSHNLCEKLMLIVSEIAEALEEYRAGTPVFTVYYNPSKPTKPEGFCIELADAVIRIADLAEYCGIDLTECIKLKHAYNLTRPHKHGKAF